MTKDSKHVHAAPAHKGKEHEEHSDHGKTKDTKKPTESETTPPKLVKQKKEKPVDLDTWRSHIANRKKVLFEHDVGEITLREYDNIDVMGAYVMEGFPTEGLTSILTAQFFIDALQLPLIGDITCNSFPPTCAVKNYFPAQACRVHGNKQLVVFISEFQLTTDIANMIVDCIFEFARRHRCKGIITTDGFPAHAVDDLDEEDPDDDEDDDDDDPLTSNIKVSLTKSPAMTAMGGGGDDDDDDDDDDGAPIEDEQALMAKLAKITQDLDKNIEPHEVRFLTNSIPLGEACIKLEHRPLASAVIQGITGGLLADMMIRDMDVICLLTPYNPMLSTDTKGALILSRTIITLLGLQNVETSKLATRVARLERKVKKAIARIAGPGIGAKEAPSGMYL